MAITITNLIVSNTVPSGTTIGVLTTTDEAGTAIPCNYMLTKGSIGYFAIAGNNLVTAWSVPATPGHYSVRIRAISSNTVCSGSATFTVDVEISVPPQLHRRRDQRGDHSSNGSHAATSSAAVTLNPN